MFRFKWEQKMSTTVDLTVGVQSKSNNMLNTFIEGRSMLFSYFIAAKRKRVHFSTQFHTLRPWQDARSRNKYLSPWERPNTCSDLDQFVPWKLRWRRFFSWSLRSSFPVFLLVSTGQNSDGIRSKTMVLEDKDCWWSTAFRKSKTQKRWNWWIGWRKKGMISRFDCKKW